MRKELQIHWITQHAIRNSNVMSLHHTTPKTLTFYLVPKILMANTLHVEGLSIRHAVVQQKKMPFIWQAYASSGSKPKSTAFSKRSVSSGLTTLGPAHTKSGYKLWLTSYNRSCLRQPCNVSHEYLVLQKNMWSKSLYGQKSLLGRTNEEQMMF